MPKESEAVFTITIKGYVKGGQTFNPSDLEQVLPSNYKWLHKGVSYNYLTEEVEKMKALVGVKD